MSTPNSRLLCLIAFYVFYLFAGAFVFHALEAPRELQTIDELNEYVRQFKRNYDSCLDSNDLNEFIRVISIANDKGVPAIRNVTKEQNWSLGQAIFFAGTVLTTIGYGNVSPLTKLGKLFCIVFALVGIPATLLLLYAFIERLMRISNYSISLINDLVVPYLNNKLASCRLVITRSHARVFFVLMCTAIVFVLFFLLPALLYANIEHWSFLNAFYYCFISLSTVGLGDYVPGDSGEQRHRHLYKILSTIYLMSGVMVMIWLLLMFSETQAFNMYKYFTLAKDGILTSHRDTVHLASSRMASEKSINLVDSSNSSVNYQRQLNENLSSQKYETTLINQPSLKSSNEKNDDENSLVP